MTNRTTCEEAGCFRPAAYIMDKRVRFGDEVWRKKRALCKRCAHILMEMALAEDTSREFTIFTELPPLPCLQHPTQRSGDNRRRNKRWVMVFALYMVSIGLMCCACAGVAAVDVSGKWAYPCGVIFGFALVTLPFAFNELLKERR